jgi:hypothetical protein
VPVGMSSRSSVLGTRGQFCRLAIRTDEQELVPTESSELLPAMGNGTLYLACCQYVMILPLRHVHRLRHKLCFTYLPPRRSLPGSQADLPLTPQLREDQNQTIEYQRKEDEMPR